MNALITEHRLQVTRHELIQLKTGLKLHTSLEGGTSSNSVLLQNLTPIQIRIRGSVDKVKRYHLPEWYNKIG